MLIQNENFKNSRSLGLFVLIAVTAVLRLFDLGSKPPHFDEGINGHFVTTIWRDGYYDYDPTNFHGPLYFYLCHLAEILLGRSIDSFRAMNGVLSILVVFTIYQFRLFVGRSAVFAAWIVSLSPAFIFYGRYAIHETLFVIGQLLFVYGRFSWMGRPTRASIGWMAAGIVILVSTKETFFIFLGTWIIAEVVICKIEKFETSGHEQKPWTRFKLPGSLARRELFFAIASISGLAALALVALYTGFFEHPSGLTDFFRAFSFWSKTGVELKSGHEKPFGYWLELLKTYEWPLLIGLLISLYSTICLTVDNRKQRVLLLTGFGTWLAYSIIPYKTPWLILNLWPLAFFVLPQFDGPRVSSLARRLLLTGLVVVLVISTYKAWQISFVNSTDHTEPYVYVQTTQDYSAALAVLRKKVARNPEVRNTSIVVMIQDPWPLPFDLSLYPNMRYAKIADIAKDTSIVEKAGVMLIDGSILEGLRNVMPKRFARMKFQLRDAYGSGWALFDAELFQEALAPDVEMEDVEMEEAVK